MKEPDPQEPGQRILPLAPIPAQGKKTEQQKCDGRSLLRLQSLRCITEVCGGTGQAIWMARRLSDEGADETEADGIPSALGRMQCCAMLTRPAKVMRRVVKGPDYSD